MKITTKDSQTQDAITLMKKNCPAHIKVCTGSFDTYEINSCVTGS